MAEVIEPVVGAVAKAAGEVGSGIILDVWKPLPWYGKMIGAYGVSHFLYHLLFYEGVHPNIRREVDRISRDEDLQKAYSKAFHAARNYGEYGKLERLLRSGDLPPDMAKGIAQAIADHHKKEREGGKS